MQVELEKKRDASRLNRAELLEETRWPLSVYFIFALPRFAVAVFMKVRESTAYTITKGIVSSTADRSRLTTLSPAAAVPIHLSTVMPLRVSARPMLLISTFCTMLLSWL